MNAQQIAETFHEVDPATGFLQTKGPYAVAFTAERKKQFLDVYRANGLMMRKTCNQLGLSGHTINHHLSIDPEFKKALVDAQAEYAEELEAKQRSYALDPKHFMDRAMQLRYLLPERYAQDQKQQTSSVVINIQGDLVIDAKKRADLIDAEIVREAEVAKTQTASITENSSAKM